MTAKSCIFRICHSCFLTKHSPTWNGRKKAEDTSSFSFYKIYTRQLKYPSPATHVATVFPPLSETSRVRYHDGSLNTCLQAVVDSFSLLNFYIELWPFFRIFVETLWPQDFVCPVKSDMFDLEALALYLVTWHEENCWWAVCWGSHSVRTTSLHTHTYMMVSFAAHFKAVRRFSSGKHK